MCGFHCRAPASPARAAGTEAPPPYPGHTEPLPDRRIVSCSMPLVEIFSSSPGAVRSECPPVGNDDFLACSAKKARAGCNAKSCLVVLPYLTSRKFIFRKDSERWEQSRGLARKRLPNRLLSSAKIVIFLKESASRRHKFRSGSPPLWLFCRHSLSGRNLRMPKPSSVGSSREAGSWSPWRRPPKIRTGRR